MKILDAKKALTQKQLEELVANTELSKSAKIKTMFEHGMEVKEIATLLNIRYNFAYNVIQNYIIVNSVQVENEKRETKKDGVFLLFDEGKTLGEVARELKMNYNYVWKLHQEWKKIAEAAAAKEDQVAGQ